MAKKPATKKKTDAIDALAASLREQKERGAKEVRIECGSMAGVYKL